MSALLLWRAGPTDPDSSQCVSIDLAVLFAEFETVE